jgi:uncharacterized membrane protein YgcG
VLFHFFFRSSSHHASKVGLIIGLILGILALCAAAFVAFLLYKRHQREKQRRDNQRARLLAISDVSEVHLPERNADLPHIRPPYFSKPWAGPSLENLGHSLRITPFPWPLNRNGSSGSPSSPRADRAERDRAASRGPFESNANAGNDREGLISGRSSARRPAMDSHATSSSSVLRRIRSNRFGSSGFGFGTPSSGNGVGGGYGSSGGGYRSLGDSGYNSTPSSNPPVRSANTSSSFFAAGSGNPTGAGAGRDANTSSDSQYSGANGPVHKSPLPASYQQHVSRQPSSDENPFSDPSPLPFGFPLRGGPNDSLVRPDSTPSGPRPVPGMPVTPGELRPGMDRADTGGSVWEVPPTYSSLRRKAGREIGRQVGQGQEQEQEQEQR